MANDASSILAATDLVVRYNEQVVLDGASLTIHEGEHVGLVGRNGSGKSTFLKILAGQQTPDRGSVTSRRDLVISYLSQDFTLAPAKNVYENIRNGAQPVLDLIAEFESLPAESKQHAPLEERIAALDGWSVDRRILTAMSHLGVPDGERRIDSLSGGEKRRVAMCRAIVSRPDFLMLDEPTNHLDPESIDWVAEFLENFSGTFLVVTHDRYFLDRVTGLIVELANGTFYSYDGNYTDYLVAKAEREAAEELIEHKRQMFLRRELEWVRRGPSARRTKSKSRLEAYHEIAEQSAPQIDEEVELIIPPPPQLGNRVVELINLGMELGGRMLFRGFNFTFENGQRIGVAGRNGLGKTTLLKIIIGELPPTEGSVKIGQLTRFNYVDQGRLRLREDRTVYEEVADGAEVVPFGEDKLSVRAYLKRFLFTDDRINTQVKFLSGGERSRLLLARVLKNGGNFLILDEPTNDLDLPTLRVLEEALIAFPGVVLVVSHDRYFLNRVCTGILAFEGGGRIVHSVGNYDYYLEKKQRPLGAATREQAGNSSSKKPASPSRDTATKLSRARKLTWKQARELDGMETQLQDAESNIVRLETLFATPDFHRTYGAQTGQIVAELAAAKENLTRLYARWEELESIKAGNEQA
jgi:ATP-binding cassette subfamily F protein uup